MRLKIKHPWNLSLYDAWILQKELSKKICLKSIFNSINEIKSIAGCDVSFENGKIKSSVVIMSFPKLELIDKFRISKKDDNIFPYIPGYLAFREGPIIVELLQQIKFKPDVILFDGQGIAHPRKIGIATHIGILFNLPTIGCAKSFLYGEYDEPLKYKGEKSYLKDSAGEIIGAVLCTRSFIKPIFVSPGYKISVDISVEVVLKCCNKYRLPDPLRFAHSFSKLDKLFISEKH